MDVFMCRCLFCCVCRGRFGSDRGGRDRLSSWRGVSFSWGVNPAYATEIGSFYSFVLFGPVKRGRGSEAAASSDGGHAVEARRPRDCVFYQLPWFLLRGVEGLGESDMGTVGERAGALDCAVQVGLSGVDESEILTAGLSGSVACVAESSGPMYIAVAYSGCVRKCDGLLELEKGAPMYLNLRASDGAERMCVECSSGVPLHRCGELEGLS